MLKRLLLLAIFTVMATSIISSQEVHAAPPGQPSDWQRFYHYPYIYYPHSFRKPQTYNSLYHRYSPEMQIPVYNKANYNFYPTEKLYHSGHHFILDAI